MNLIYLCVRNSGKSLDFFAAYTNHEVSFNEPNRFEKNLTLINRRRYFAYDVLYLTGNTKIEKIFYDKTMRTAAQVESSVEHALAHSYHLYTFDDAKKLYPDVARIIEESLLLETLKT